MSWTMSDVERWLRNAGKGKTIVLTAYPPKFSAVVEGNDHDPVEFMSSTLVGAVEGAMQEIQRRVDRPVTPAARVPEPVMAVQASAGSGYPKCPSCSGDPTIVYCDGRSNCRCGHAWTMPIGRGTRVKLTNGHVYEFDGALWDLAIP